MTAYGLEPGRDVSIVNSDALLCAGYEGYSGSTKEALQWVEETFAKAEPHEHSLAHGLLIGVADHWVGAVLAKEGGKSLLVYFDSMNWEVTKQVADYYEAGNKKFEELVASDKVKPSQRLYVIRSYIARTKYIREEYVFFPHLFTFHFSISLDCSICTHTFFRIEFIAKLASGRVTISQRIAYQKVMSVVASYEQARKLDYAEMPLCDAVCAWVRENPQSFFDNFVKALNEETLEGFDDSAVADLCTMATEITTAAGCCGGKEGECEPGAACAKEVKRALDVARATDAALNNLKRA